jgi:hypothetical protein
MSDPRDPDDIEGFDDLPSTHLDDDEYDAFLARELDAEGRVRGEPRVTLWLGVGIAVLVILALWLFL